MEKHQPLNINEKIGNIINSEEVYTEKNCPSPWLDKLKKQTSVIK